MTESKQLKPFDQLTLLAEKKMPEFEKVLQGIQHTSASRIVRAGLSEVANSPKLLECDPYSVLKSIMTCAKLALEPNGLLGQAYFIPFKNECQVIPGYKGYISLARNSGEVLTIEAHEVRENDTFHFEYGTGSKIKHTQFHKDTGKLMQQKERGEIYAVWAGAKLKGGGYQFVVMTRDEVEAIRNASSGYRNAVKWAKNGVIKSPWIEHEQEMFKKTAIRRLVKLLPFSITKIHNAAAIENAVDGGQAAYIPEDQEGVVIEGEAVQVDDGDTPNIEGDVLDFEAMSNDQLDAFAEQQEQKAEAHYASQPNQ